MALSEIIQPFMWGEGGKKRTPEELAREREIADALLAQGIDTSPVAHPLQGVARVANAMAGAYRRSGADRSESANQKYSSGLLSQLMGGGGGIGSGGFPAAPPASAPRGGPSPVGGQAAGNPNVGSTIDFARAAPANPNAAAIRAGLIGRGLPEHVADGFLMNFQDESGLNPGINEQNPTVPGSRGGFGLYQLTGPRRVAYERFAAERGVDPSDTDAQLDFLMTELQGPEARAAESILAAPDAGSAAAAIARDFLRPAQSHLNARVARYMGGAPPQQVASLDPSIGMPAAAPEVGLSPERQMAIAAGLPGNEGLGLPGQQTAALPEDRTGYDAFNSVPIAPAPMGGAAMQGQDVTPPPQAMMQPSPMGGPGAMMPPPPSAPDQWAGMREADPMQQVAQAMPQERSPMSGSADAQQAGGMGALNPAIMEALSSPYVSESVKGIAKILLQQQLEQQDPMRALQMRKMQQEIDAGNQPEYDFITGRDGSIFRSDKRKGDIQQVYGGKPDQPSDVQEYEYARGQGYAGSFADWQLENKRAGASQVNIDQKAEGAFEKELAVGQAKTFNTMAEEGLNARADLGIIGELDALLKGQGGALTGLQGWAAQKGIDLGGATSDLQAAQALINKLVPTQRQPGSGSMSDRDVELFTRSLPSLWNLPGGNQKIINVMRGLAQYKQAQGEIADQVMVGEMSRQEARRALRELPNPLAEFRNMPAPKAASEKPLSEMSDDELKAIIDGQ